MTDTPGDAPKKLPLTSMDIAGEKREQLKKCLAETFPEIMAEDAVDFDQLKRVLGEWVEPGRERFGLDWPGKAACMKTIQAPSIATLKPCREESVDWETTQNVFIEGDNLEALKLLQKAYFGKVKMIYIDPPYNTGNEFIYPDKFSENLDTYLLYSGQKDDAGNLFTTNTDRNGRFHSRWLNMMYPRLYLAKNLLREDGSIWISIDDNELQNLLSICDNIFGQENFISVFVWQKRKTRENRKVFSTNHDYIVCFSKEKNKFESVRNSLPLTDEVRARYKNPDDDPRGAWQSVSLNAQSGHGTKAQFYTIELPSGRRVDPPAGRCWTVTKNRLGALVADNRVWFGSNGDNSPRLKYFLKEEEKGLTPHTLWLSDEVGTTDSAKKNLINLFDGVSVYDTPKPVDLIKRIMHISAVGDGIALDFFAGSAPIAEATYQYNAENGTHARYVAVQLPEKIDIQSEPGQAGFSNISEVAKERIRRAKPVQGECLANDYGFRAFRLDRSNFKVWDDDPRNLDDDLILRRMEQHTDPILPGATAESMLFELLLKAGYPLTEPMERLEIAGKEVFSVGKGTLLICLERELTQDLMTALAEMEPSRVICLDAGFQGNDQLKTNAAQTFKTRARNTESAIEFHTV